MILGRFGLNRRTLSAIPATWCLLAASGLFLGSHLATAKPEGFYLERLPKGKDVTIPIPATTFVPLSARVQLTATDMPQTLSFKPVNIANGLVHPIRISIYDSHSDRVKYVDLTPGTPFLYAFKELSSITVIPAATGKARTAGNVLLQIESNKPLEIAH